MNQSPQDTSGTAMAIQGLVQSVDLVTDALERKWGVGRLRLLVGDGLRERFDRQWAKWQAAYAAQDLEAVRAHSEAMRRAWAALERGRGRCHSLRKARVTAGGTCRKVARYARFILAFRASPPIG